MIVPEVSVQAPNSLLLIGDPAGEPPKSMEGLVAATSSCLAVGTLMSQDGPTRVRVLDESSNVALPATLAWEGSLSVPGGVLKIGNVYHETYLEWKVDVPNVRLRVLVNDANEPDDIAIVVSA